MVGGQSDAEDMHSIADMENLLDQDDAVLHSAPSAEATQQSQETCVEDMVSDATTLEDVPTTNDNDAGDLASPVASQPGHFPFASNYSTAYDFGDAPHFDYDRDRCEALVWVAKGVSLRQCSCPRKFGERCGTHKKRAPHGTVWSPSVSKITESRSQPARRKEGFTWYCRIRLWHEARNNYKTSINALSDDQFEACLLKVHNYY